MMQVMCVGFLVVLSFCVFVKWWVTLEWYHWRRSFWVSQRRIAPLRTCELFGRRSRSKSTRKRCSVSAYRISARTSWKTYTTGPRYSITSVEDKYSSIEWYSVIILALKWSQALAWVLLFIEISFGYNSNFQSSNERHWWLLRSVQMSSSVCSFCFT